MFVDELVYVSTLETDNSTDAVAGQLPGVDEAVERAYGHAEVLARLCGAHPDRTMHGLTVRRRGREGPPQSLSKYERRWLAPSAARA